SAACCSSWRRCGSCNVGHSAAAPGPAPAKATIGARSGVTGSGKGREAVAGMAAIVGHRAFRCADRAGQGLPGPRRFPGDMPWQCHNATTMQIPYELALGWRYTRAGRATRRNGFISFISGVSMLGIALGVAALIIVLSVMNGFQKEVRDRMLSVVSHIEIFAPQGAALPDVARTLAEARQNPNVIGAAPFVGAQALLARGEDMKGTMVRGIDPALEGAVTDLAAANEEVLKLLVSGEFRVVLGGELARSMGVRAGDVIPLSAPAGQVTPAGVVPRLKQMTVAGTFDSGHYE